MFLEMSEDCQRHRPADCPSPCEQYGCWTRLSHAALQGLFLPRQARLLWLLPSSPLHELDSKGFTKQINNVNEIAASTFHAGKAYPR